MIRSHCALAVSTVLLATGCSESRGPAPAVPAPSPPSAASSSSPTPSPSDTASPTDSPTAQQARQRRVRPDDLDRAVAWAAVRHLADRIGPRHGTSPAFARAADWLAGELEDYGYRVRRETFPVPGGDSWGTQVPAGPSVNVVAVEPGFDPREPHLVVGAHLDTVPQAPGAEDNASGVGAMLAVAQAVSGRRTRLPVVFVGFGAEEPRGPTDDDHHYGSRAYVAALGPAERRSMRAMVSLDRVGVGAQVPVGSASASDPVQQALLAAAERAGVPAFPDQDSRSSDHWSFVRDGLPAARLGSTPYAAYHLPADVSSVVDPAQLARTGRIVLAWLAG